MLDPPRPPPPRRRGLCLIELLLIAVIVDTAIAHQDSIPLAPWALWWEPRPGVWQPVGAWADVGTCERELAVISERRGFSSAAPGASVRLAEADGQVVERYVCLPSAVDPRAREPK